MINKKIHFGFLITSLFRRASCKVWLSLITKIAENWIYTSEFDVVFEDDISLYDALGQCILNVCSRLHTMTMDLIVIKN